MRFLSSILISVFLVSSVAYAENLSVPAPTFAIDAKSAVLIEQSSGRILFEKEADAHLPIASVTKIMTLLLIMEALDNGVITMDTMVTCSEFASTMGGSQVYLKQGEQMSVNDMLKAIAVSSGNDASVAMAEHLAGNEQAFVQMMNERAAHLGMKNTKFINCNGLDEQEGGAHSSARDVALMSRELLNHPKIHDYLTIWMDSLRNGEFELANTNKLIRFYQGANGIKTGSTSEALYCLSASAKRDNMQLIAVVLGAPDNNVRFGNASSLLDYGFANYAVLNNDSKKTPLGNVFVNKGTVSSVSVTESSEIGAVVPKAKQNMIKKEINLPKEMPAPVQAGQRMGSIDYTLDGEVVASIDLVAEQSSEKLNMFQMLMRFVEKMVTFK